MVNGLFGLAKNQIFSVWKSSALQEYVLPSVGTSLASCFPNVAIATQVAVESIKYLNSTKRSEEKEPNQTCQIMTPSIDKTPRANVLQSVVDKVSHHPTVNTAKKRLLAIWNDRIVQECVIPVVCTSMMTYFPKTTLALTLSYDSVDLLTVAKSPEEKKAVENKRLLIVATLLTSAIAATAVSLTSNPQKGKELFNTCLYHIGSIVAGLRLVDPRAIFGGKLQGAKDSVIFRLAQQQLILAAADVFLPKAGLLYNSVIPMLGNYVFYANPFFNLKHSQVNYYDIGEVVKHYLPSSKAADLLPANIQNVPFMKNIINYFLQKGIDEKKVTNVLIRCFNDFVDLLENNHVKLALNQVKSADLETHASALNHFKKTVADAILSQTSSMRHLLASQLRSKIPFPSQEEFTRQIDELTLAQGNENSLGFTNWVVTKLVNNELTYHILLHFLDFACIQIPFNLSNINANRHLEKQEIHHLYKNISALFFAQAPTFSGSNTVQKIVRYVIPSFLDFTAPILAKEIHRLDDTNSVLINDNLIKNKLNTSPHFLPPVVEPFLVTKGKILLDLYHGLEKFSMLFKESVDHMMINMKNRFSQLTHWISQFLETVLILTKKKEVAPIEIKLEARLKKPTYIESLETAQNKQVVEEKKDLNLDAQEILNTALKKQKEQAFIQMLHQL